MNYAKLLFPLNVYAYILEEQEGRADYLHFGLFNDSDCTVQQAQQASTELLIENLPAPPAQILEVGAGLGTLYARLTAMGYQVTAINPDVMQVAIACERLSDPSAIKPVKFEDFVSDQHFDVILLQEVSQYIPLQTLFTRAVDMLTAGGRILLVDEMKSGDKVDSALHSLEEYRRLGAEHGFSLQDELDLTEQARPSVDYLLKAIAELHEGILAELDVSQEQLEQLQTALLDYQQKYADGSYLYYSLKFTKSK